MQSLPFYIVILSKQVWPEEGHFWPFFRMLAFNPLMPKLPITFVPQFKCIVFKKQMLQGANTDIFNPLVPKAHSDECQNIRFFTNYASKSQIKVKLADFFFL